MSTSRGQTATVRATPARIAWLRAKHVAGASRLGLSPVRRGRCRWGAIDLDAHDIHDEPRFDDALALADALILVGLTPYLERSRGGRGYHVWVFLDEPGARAEDLHSLLSTLASEVRPADVFPSAPTGRGNMIYLPGFGGTPLLTRDLDMVAPEHVELDDPALVALGIRPPGSGGAWPPRYWCAPAGGGGSALWHGLDNVRELLKSGRDGLIHAQRGARNRIAGAMAGRVLERGGDWDAYLAWDRGNDPPLASDEPDSLRRWWRWAERRRERGKRA